MYLYVISRNRVFKPYGDTLITRFYAWMEIPRYPDRVRTGTLVYGYYCTQDHVILKPLFNSQK